ncbi:MAG: DUF6320 domain-containing protein [Bacilli bacterium]|nr:DUF6320 domain-containing protein [Bacilli bacterium]MDD4733509.1 DUF6320 domain-containing protein [Bacilli bacterium]
MKYCDKCNVSIKSDNQKCPLCQEKLIEEDSYEVFPKVKTIYQTYETFLNWLIFGTILISIISFFINILVSTKVMWSFFVIFGTVCLLFVLGNAIKLRYNIPKNISRQIIIISLLSFLWDYFTGYRGWSINYVIPIVCAIGSVNLTILSVIMKRYIEEYLFYYFLITLFGLVPFIFLVTNLANVFYPSFICVILNLLLLMFIFFIKSKEILSELKRVFHI